MADRYYIKDSVTKTAIHHNSFKDLWKSKWAFPVRRLLFAIAVTDHRSS
jgi:hypothetical protein